MPEPREWQKIALTRWLSNGTRGVISVATGGGKTFFAFLAHKELSPGTILLVVVPTEALQDQWVVNITEELNVPESQVGILNSRSAEKDLKKWNVVVINSARKLDISDEVKRQVFLVVDECHRSGSYENSKALIGKWGHTLGLSATPERQFDDGFQRYIQAALGEIIFEYSVADAIKDGVLTPFQLINIEVPLTGGEQEKHDKYTRQIARLMGSNQDSESKGKIEMVLRSRARNYQNALGRIPVTVQIMEDLHGSRTIIFHESISAVEKISNKLKQRNHSVVTYHSKISSKLRRDNLRLFRKGLVNVLVTCRALDEGLNIPETEVAIISSATSSDRQRIQRLGRVLRPSKGKESATVYTLFSTEIERKRLQEESEELPDVVDVNWKEVKFKDVDNS